MSNLSRVAGSAQLNVINLFTLKAIVSKLPAG